MTRLVISVRNVAEAIAAAAGGADLIDLKEPNRGALGRVDAAVHGGREVGLFRYLTRLTGGRYVPLPSPR